MKRVLPVLIAVAACSCMSFAQTANESDPNFNADTDPCFRVKSDLRYALSQVKAHSKEAKEWLAKADSYSNTKRNMEAAALDGAVSAASDLVEAAKCAAFLGPGVPVEAPLKFTRAMLTIALIVLPGASGVDLTGQAIASYNYHAGEAKKWGDRASALEKRVRECCSPYLRPPADTNPPPPNPTGGGGPITPGSGSGSGAAGGGGTDLSQGGASDGSGYFDLTGSGRVRGSDPTGGPGGDGGQYGFYGHPGYLEVQASNMTGLRYLRIKGVMDNITLLERHCEEVDRLFRLPNPPLFARKTKVATCYKDAAYGAGYVVEEINQRTRRGFTAEEVERIRSLLPQATAQRTRATQARAASDKFLLTR